MNSRRNYSMFDEPLTSNPLIQRVKKAEADILAAGLPYHMVRPITRDAANWAGNDHEAYAAYVAWRIVGYKAEKVARQQRHEARIKTLKKVGE